MEYDPSYFGTGLSIEPLIKLYLTKLSLFHCRLTLDVITFKHVFRDIKTAQKTSASVSLIAEVQIMQDLQHFARASDYFLGKSIEEIGSIVLNVLGAHLQEVYGELTLKCIQEGTSNSSDFNIKI